MKKSPELGRLAMRHEGTFWVAYYALPDTMNGALELGRIAMRFIVDSPERKDAFMGMMRDAVGDLVEEMTGARPEWPDEPRSAPEHERSGHG